MAMKCLLLMLAQNAQKIFLSLVFPVKGIVAEELLV